MKKQLSIALLIIVSLAAVLSNLSCGGSSQNNSIRNNTVSGNPVASNTDRSTEVFVDADCSGEPPIKKEKIKEKVKRNIDGDKRLNYQHESCQSGCRKGRFFFEPVMQSNDSATLYIWGSIFIQETDDLDNLHKKYKDLLEKGCVEKVVFTPPPSLSPTPGIITTSEQHFEYTIMCEAPNQICIDGSCREDCKKKDVNVNNDMSSNSNK